MSDFEKMGVVEFVVHHPDYCLIPLHTLNSLREYVRSGRPVGHFLESVLNNDLCGAVDRGDRENLETLPELVRLIKCQCPSGCHKMMQCFGDGHNAVADWCNKKTKDAEESI